MSETYRLEGGEEQTNLDPTASALDVDTGDWGATSFAGYGDQQSVLAGVSSRTIDAHVAPKPMPDRDENITRATVVSPTKATTKRGPAEGRARISYPPQAPKTRTDNEWWHKARCKGMDTNKFYQPDQDDGSSTRLRRERAAKAICAVCPVSKECLDWAIENGERAGIWGGLTPVERGVARRQRV